MISPSALRVPRCLKYSSALSTLSALSAQVPGESECSESPGTLSAFRVPKWDNILDLFCPNKKWYRGGIGLVELAQFIYLLSP